MSRKKEKRRATSCTSKKVHYDFWTIIQHCSSLEKILPYSPIHPYKCDFCDGWHVSTRGPHIATNKLTRALSRSLQIMKDFEWWQKAPQSVIKHRIDLEMFLLRELTGNNQFYLTYEGPVKPPFPIGTIDSFSHNTTHYFLSNFYPTKITYEDLTFSSVEHAYQAAKSTDFVIRRLIQSCASPTAAKKQGVAVSLREDWDIIKFPIMEQLIEQKFARGSVLSEQLLNTEDVLLIEGNYWHDVIWGQCFCSRHQWEGSNRLGIILMNRRLALRETNEST